MWSSVFVVIFVLVKGSNQRHLSSTGKFKFGKEAEILCNAYKKVCPHGKQCVIQELVWPRKMSFPVCVFETENPVKSKICELPPAPGHCKAQFRRWYYNVNARKCSWFTFGGCRGNLNNFRSEEACISACLGEIKEVTTASSPFIINVTPSRPDLVRQPELLPAPAPLPFRHAPETVISALNLKSISELEEASGMKEFRLKRKRGRGRGRKHRCTTKKCRNKSRRRKNRDKKARAELRMRKTSYRLKPEKIQNDQGNIEIKIKHKTRKHRRPKSRRHSSAGRGSYYDNIRLFTILHHRPASRAKNTNVLQSY